jgi:hypothetical protein
MRIVQGQPPLDMLGAEAVHTDRLALAFAFFFLER